MSGKRKPLDRSPKGSSGSDDDTVPYKDGTETSTKERSKSRPSPSTKAKEVDQLTTDLSVYHSVVSPGGSSTSSGPIYVRPPGFKHHGQAVTASSLVSKGTKKKKKAFLTADISDLLRKKSASVAPLATSEVDGTDRSCRPHPLAKSSLDLTGAQLGKPRAARKEPLPMKLRAFPQSFWQQPNVAGSVAPGQIYSVLPPVVHKDVHDVADIRPVTPPDDKGENDQAEKNKLKDCNRIIKVQNTDWLFKLFEGFDGYERIPVVKRGRPKKVTCTAHRQILRGDDPCMVNMGSDALLPLLPLDRSQAGGQPLLTMISLQDRDKSVSLPALHIERNYSQLLSELAVKL